MNGDHRVLLIGGKMNYMINSLQENLKKCFLEVEVMPADIESVSRVVIPYDGIIIYSNVAIAIDTTFLVYMKDLINEKNVPLFIVGDNMEIEELKKVIPEHLIRTVFLRPINVKEVCVQIASELENSKAVVRKTILIVDDSPVMLHNLKGWLEDKYDVISAESGITAIKYMFQRKPDLVLLDYEMPVTNGKQVLEMIRNEIELSDIPVIFLTSHGDRDHVLEVMSLRPSGYLLKSMKPVDIVRAINDFFFKKGKF